MKIKENIKELRGIFEEAGWATRKDEILNEIDEIELAVDECESQNDNIVKAADKIRDILY